MLVIKQPNKQSYFTDLITTCRSRLYIIIASFHAGIEPAISGMAARQLRHEDDL